MEARGILSVACLAAWASLASPARGGLVVTPDKENVVASRLAGKWAVERKLTARLGGRLGGEIDLQAAVEFTNDPTVAHKIPEKYEDFLKPKRIYMAGTMKMKAKACPFLLIELKGNPHVIIFRERDGDPMGDAESFNVMLAVAKDKANDLLFIGGDVKEQPFSAYERADRHDDR